MIRILHVFNGMDCGGAENMIMNLYRRIDRSKIQFDFLVHTKKECFFDDEIKSLGGKIYYIPSFKGYNLKEYINALKKFFEGNNEYFIVHGHMGRSASIYLKIAGKYGLLTIAHSHSTNPGGFSLENVLYKVLAFPTRFVADYFLACSVDGGISRYGKKITRQEKFYVLKNAFDVKKYEFSEDIRDSKRKELGLESEFVVGHVGRFNEVKNHAFLLKVFKSYTDTNENAVLLLAGDGELRNKIEEEAKALNIYDKIRFLGVRKDVNELLMAMDVFVFPSLYEGLGIVIMEAQATGLKCVISDNIPSEVNCTDLIIRKGLKENSDKWAQAISKDTYNRKKYNKELIDCGYNIDDTAKWIEEFYLKICIDNHKKGDTIEM